VDAVRPPTAPSLPTAAAWPRPAQLAAAFLLGAACALLGVRLVSGPAGRPLDLAAAPPLDLNRAELADLRQLPGVGPTLAGRIAEHRDGRGGFRSVDDLRTVPGVGPARLERLRPWVRVEDGGEPADTGAMPAPAARPPAAAPKKAEALKEPIDLNRATAEQLQKLPGVGPKLAQRILDERAKAPFKSVEELRRVGGIGPKTLAKLRPFVTAGDPPPRPADAD
jgi:competence protein ComEA